MSASAEHHGSWSTLVRSLKQDRQPSEVSVRFKPAGRAPILRQQVYQVASNAPFSTITGKLNELLKRDRSSTIYCYIASSFIPAPDEVILNLWSVSRYHGRGGELD